MSISRGIDPSIRHDLNCTRFELQVLWERAGRKAKLGSGLNVETRQDCERMRQTLCLPVSPLSIAHGKRSLILALFFVIDEVPR